MRQVISSNDVSQDSGAQSPGGAQQHPMGGYATGGRITPFWDEVMQSGQPLALASQMSKHGVIDGPFAETKEVIGRPDGAIQPGVQRCAGI